MCGIKDRTWNTTLLQLKIQYNGQSLKTSHRNVHRRLTLSLHDVLTSTTSSPWHCSGWSQTALSAWESPARHEEESLWIHFNTEPTINARFNKQFILNLGVIAFHKAIQNIWWFIPNNIVSSQGDRVSSTVCEIQGNDLLLVLQATGHQQFGLLTSPKGCWIESQSWQGTNLSFCPWARQLTHCS